MTTKLQQASSTPQYKPMPMRIASYVVSCTLLPMEQLTGRRSRIVEDAIRQASLAPTIRFFGAKVPLLGAGPQLLSA